MFYSFKSYNLILSKSFYFIIKDFHYHFNPQLMNSKSKKSSTNQVQKPVTSKVSSKPSVNNQQNNTLTNAQQQMASNLQQLPIQQNIAPSLFQVQQGPVSFNQPVQIMQNFVPPQMSNQMPITQQTTNANRQIFGGVYGRRNQHNPVKHPDVFNDDEAIV